MGMSMPEQRAGHSRRGGGAVAHAVVRTLVGLLAWPLAAGAVQLGQTDSFADGLDGWGSGAASPQPPAVVAAGGPAGAADAWLQVTSTGQQGAGGKLVAIAGDQWAGNYTAAGVTGLSMWVQNPGATDLSLRLWLNAPAGNAISLDAVLLPAGSAWQAVRFNLLPAALNGPAASVLADVREVRLFHGTAAAFPGGNIAARLGMDNVTAVPEPGTTALWLAGLAGLLALRTRTGRRLSATHHQE